MQRLSDAPMHLLSHTPQPTAYTQLYPQPGGGAYPPAPGSNVSNPGPFDANNKGLWHGPQPPQPPTNIVENPHPSNPLPPPHDPSWGLGCNYPGFVGSQEPLLDTANDDLANTIAVGKHGCGEAQQQQQARTAQLQGCTRAAVAAHGAC